ncbi:hypothetical protein K0651_11225 [Ornithinimicrobium sp. Arc0846-15]|nr:hypothetical protein [Ornithinimicrobium laminariae]
MSEPTDTTTPDTGDIEAPPMPAESETDRLVANISGVDDQVGMAALWRVTMDLENWWFIAVGDEGQESPAAAEIDDQLMLLAFTDAERARHFAVAQSMIEAEDNLSAIALTPDEVVNSADAYVEAGIDGLMFDPHISGYFIPSAQLPVVHQAVKADPDSEAPQG